MRWIFEFLCPATSGRLACLRFRSLDPVPSLLASSREIDSVLEAYQLLNEWPQTTRGPKHLDALHNCAAVLGGRGSARDARRAFEAFAADRGILAPDLLQMSANRYATEWLGRRCAA